MAKMKREWERFVEEDVNTVRRSTAFDGRDEMDISNDVVKQESEYLVQSEWPLSFPMPIPSSVGPW